jgi:hypothetical protein
MHARGRYDAGTSLYICIDPHSTVVGSAPPHPIHPIPSIPSIPSIVRLYHANLSATYTTHTTLNARARPGSTCRRRSARPALRRSLVRRAKPRRGLPLDLPTERAAVRRTQVQGATRRVCVHVPCRGVSTHGHPSIHPSIHPSTPSTCLPTYLPIYPPIHPSTSHYQHREA